VARSLHFAAREFRCPHCGVQRSSPRLLERLERLRLYVRKPIIIVSGYRCPIYNREIGGAQRSQHLYGRAADIPYGLASLVQARNAGFTGIGHKDGWALHVDVRAGARAEWRY
jgi:uncharacterized protein YcbK (DUF882 family)